MGTPRTCPKCGVRNISTKCRKCSFYPIPPEKVIELELEKRPDLRIEVELEDTVSEEIENDKSE